MVDDEGIQKTPKKKAYVFRSGVAPTLAKCSSVLDCKDADLVIDKKKELLVARNIDILLICSLQHRVYLK